ncbi:MAG: ABC transporter ATP-binding protein [Synechococcales cyanobacterium]
MDTKEFRTGNVASDDTQGHQDPASQDPTTVLSLQGIRKRFGALLANDDISLTLHRGEVLALLGENGAGKTTLMNIVFGHEVADAGQIQVFGRLLPPGSPAAAMAAGIGMVHQRFTLAENLSVLDNIVLGTVPLWHWRQGRQEAAAKIRQLGSRFGLGVDPQARVGDLSVGEQQRVEILKVLYRQARILILDEPTAVLTPQETESFFATLTQMTQEGLSIILISHKLREVLAVSQRLAVLRSGRLVATVKTPEANPETIAEWMVGRHIPAVVREPMPLGDPVLTLDQISTAGSLMSLRSVSLTVHRHELVGIAGVAGNGQNALASVICGLEQPSHGQLQVVGTVLPWLSPWAMVQQGMARIPEDRHHVGVIGSFAIWENLVAERYRDPQFSRWGWFNHRQIRHHAWNWMQEYDIRCGATEAQQALGIPTQVLSGGNMQKVILARGLAQAPQVILAHQPTRGLDVGAVAYVHRELVQACRRGAGIVLISEDLDELLALSDRVHVLYRGELSPGIPSSTADRATLGLWMAGHVAD